MATRPFFDTARDIRRGQFLDDCAEALQEAVAAVEDTGKPAKCIIEISIKPASKGGGAAIILADKVRTKLPEMPSGETIMFVTPDNNLVANDPRQKEMDLKTVNASASTEFKTVVG